jgi:hypothetical protein
MQPVQQASVMDSKTWNGITVLVRVGFASKHSTNELTKKSEEKILQTRNGLQQKTH